MTSTSLHFDPFLPWLLTGSVAVIAALILVYSAWRGLPGWPWRLAGLALILGALANPSMQFAETRGLDDIVVLVSDESASQNEISDRAAQRDTALAALETALEAREGTETRVVRIGDSADNEGTLAMSALGAALADIPGDRLAGILLLSDGQVHDPELTPQVAAPFHQLLTGRATDWDRRLILESAPAFAILGEPVTIRLRLEAQGAVPDEIGNAARLRVSVDGGQVQEIPAETGEIVELTVDLAHAGVNVVHVEMPAEDGELTDRNNGAIIQINGVRDRLRVLLVSGEPYPGGRTWRNLLKSDPAVDLVHFTILRPPEKQDQVPVSELSLIAFPTRELFLDKIDEFDLIVFDRYRRRGILPGQYLENIRAYVEAGGALLVTAGPEFASANSLFHSPIGEMLPITPTSRVVEGAFRPQVTELGARHPVSRGLGNEAEWGRWLRQIEVVNGSGGGQVVLSGNGERPLLVLDRIAEGRVALLASDQAWLWSRGYEGGGPQLDMLRRLAHWLMKEPELEEEALTVSAEGQRMIITRHTMLDGARAVTVTAPDGTITELAMNETVPGRHVAEYQAPALGLYRLTQDDLTAVAALGPASPKEFENTIAGAAALEPLVEATRGGTFRLEDGIPAIRSVAEGRNAAGRGWLGITPRHASLTLSVRLQPLLPAWAALLLIASVVLGAWLRESRR